MVLYGIVTLRGTRVSETGSVDMTNLCCPSNALMLLMRVKSVQDSKEVRSRINNDHWCKCGRIVLRQKNVM